MESKKARFRITFADHVPHEEINEFVETGFGGFGRVARTEDPRSILLTDIQWPYTFDTVTGQLAALERDGLLRWREM